MNDFNQTIINALKNIPALIDKTFPIPSRLRSKLPADVAELSRLLTSHRGERSLSYLGRPNLLSAYLRYFLPWNLMRLCLLLPNLNINLRANDTVTDLGSGTLTFVSALWIARADLRDIPLEFYCIDRSRPALEAGKKFFEALSALEGSPWKINIVREEIDLQHRKQRTHKNSKIVCAINLFNENYERIPHNNTSGLKQAAFNAAKLMTKHSKEDGSFLIVEPGVPQSGRFIQFLREEFLEMGQKPSAPCTHNGPCPLITGRGAKNKKWCHFAYENFEAPKDLTRLAASAKLPKERLVFSYLMTTAQEQSLFPQESVRVISDSFSLPKNRFGRYGCNGKGLVLLTGDKNRMDKFKSGSLVTSAVSTTELDGKSGAIIMEIK